MTNETKPTLTRDESGRFAVGNPGGPGRPPKQREQEYYELTASTVNLDDWRDVVLKAVEQAKDGDAIARRWLSDYLLGKPTQRVDLDVNEKTLSLIYVDDWRGGNGDNDA